MSSVPAAMPHAHTSLVTGPLWSTTRPDARTVCTHRAPLSCPDCDGSLDDDPRPGPCAHRYPGSDLGPAEDCCEDAVDGTPYCGLHLFDDPDPDRAYDDMRDAQEWAATQ